MVMLHRRSKCKPTVDCSCKDRALGYTTLVTQAYQRLLQKFHSVRAAGFWQLDHAASDLTCRKGQGQSNRGNFTSFAVYSRNLLGSTLSHLRKSRQSYMAQLLVS
jgi:hypothetical protein